MLKFFKIEFILWKKDKKEKGENIWNNNNNFYYLISCKVPLLISKQSHVMVWNKNLCIYRISSLKNCKKFKMEFMLTLKNDKIKIQKAFYHNCNDIVGRFLA